MAPLEQCRTCECTESCMQRGVTYLYAWESLALTIIPWNQLRKWCTCAVLHSNLYKSPATGDGWQCVCFMCVLVNTCCVCICVCVYVYMCACVLLPGHDWLQTHVVSYTEACDFIVAECHNQHGHCRSVGCSNRMWLASTEPWTLPYPCASCR